MNEIEKIQKYIERTKLSNNRNYGMNITETFELAQKACGPDGTPFEMICLAFDYGRAKGVRETRAEARK